MFEGFGITHLIALAIPFAGLWLVCFSGLAAWRPKQLARKVYCRQKNRFPSWKLQ